MRATCSACVWRVRRRDGVLTEAAVMQAARVHDDAEHRVTVWDTETSQIPRDLWNASHRMLPGSHERMDGPECTCGKPWDRWNDHCGAVTQ